MMIILRGCRLVMIVCWISFWDLVKPPLSPQKKREKARKDMRETLNYVYQQGRLQVG